jgi:undecaprenyl-diphosphatase
VHPPPDDEQRSGSWLAYPPLRIGVRAALLVILLGAAVHYLLPQTAQLKQTLGAIEDAHLGWLGVALLAAFASFPASALSVIGSAARPLPFRRTCFVELAAASMNRLTPAGLGRGAVLARFFTRSGMTRSEAIAAVSLNLAAGGAVHVLGIVVSALTLTTVGLGTPHLPAHWPWLVGLLGVLLAIGVVLGTTRRAERLIGPLRQAVHQLVAAFARPRSAIALFGGAVLVNVTFIFSLVASLAAFGATGNIDRVAFVYLAASALANAAPTPGGLGAMEAGLVAGLTRFGVTAGTAIAGVLAFRLVTYWLPIVPGLLSLRSLRKARAVEDHADDEPAGETAPLAAAD